MRIHIYCVLVLAHEIPQLSFTEMLKQRGDQVISKKDLLLAKDQTDLYVMLLIGLYILVDGQFQEIFLWPDAGAL